MKIKSFYLHFPYCIKKCNYCDFYREVYSGHGFDQYHQLLDKSWNEHQKLLQKYGCEMDGLETFYLGGGTPSMWGETGITFLEKFLKQNNIQFSDKCEFTLEANPKTGLIDDYDRWKELGVNRFSVGLQTTRQDFLEILGRVHTREDAFRVLEKLSNEAVDFSIDLMLGLPFSMERKRDICSELFEIMKFSPNHISIYILNVNKNYIHYNSLPDEDWVAEEYLRACDFLQQNSYEHYEVSNWAMPAKQSRHNINYWEPGSWVALGPSATGNFNLSTKHIRYKWHNNNSNYELEILDEKSLRLEKLFLHLRTKQGLDPMTIFTPEEQLLLNQLKIRWQEAGYLDVKKTQVSLSDKGFLVLDSLVREVVGNIKSL